MWTHIITLIVGFVAGCKFKDLFSDNKLKRGNIQTSPLDVQQEDSLNVSNNGDKTKDNFSLNSIKQTFDDYGIKIINSGSFNVLLREIRSKCYKDILKTFVEKANSPQRLVELLKNETTPSFNVDIVASNQSPFIEVSRLDDLIKRENVNPADIGDIKEKVSFLLTLSHTRGIEDFKNTLGFYFSDIIQSAEYHEDISDQYEQVMKIITNRYNYMK